MRSKSKLYNALSSAGWYTKSEEEFNNQFSNDDSISGLYEKLRGSGFYTKTEKDFRSQFFSDKSGIDESSIPVVSETEAEDLKKKVPSISKSPSPSLESISPSPSQGLKPDNTKFLEGAMGYEAPPQPGMATEVQDQTRETKYIQPDPIFDDQIEKVEAVKPKKFITLQKGLLNMDKFSRDLEAYAEENYGDIESLSEADYGKVLGAQLEQQGLTKDEIKKAELELFQKEGIALDLTGDGIQNELISNARSARSKFIGSGSNMSYNILASISSTLGWALDNAGQEEIATMFKNSGKSIEEFAMDRQGYYNKLIRSSKKGFIEDLEQGNFGAAFTTALNTTAESLPLTMLAMASTAATGSPYAATAAISSLAANNTYYQVKDEEFFKEMSDAGKVGYIAAMGTAEGIGEMFGARVLSRIAKDIGGAAAKKSLKEFVKGAARGFGMNTAEEALGEALTGATQYLTENYARGEEITVAGLLSAITESAALGAASGGMLSSAGSTISGGVRGTVAISNYIKTSEKTKKARDLFFGVREAVTQKASPETIAALSAQYAKAQKEAVEEVVENEKILSLLPESQKQKAIENSEIAQNERAKAEKAEHPAVKQVHEDNAKKAESKVLEVLNRAKFLNDQSKKQTQLEQEKQTQLEQEKQTQLEQEKKDSSDKGPGAESISQASETDQRTDLGVVTERDSSWDEGAKGNLPESGMSLKEISSKIKSGKWGMLTAENPNAKQVSDLENENANEKAVEWLEAKGYEPKPIFGKYGNSENSFFVENLSREDAIEFAKEFQQESVATESGLVYQDGSFNPRTGEEIGVSQEDFYSTINTTDGNVDFAVAYDFDKVENKPVQKTEAFTEREQAGEVNEEDATLQQEVEDLEQVIKKGPEFKSEMKTQTLADSETRAIVDEMNSSDGAFMQTDLDSAESEVPLGETQEMSNRAGQVVKTASLNDIDGVPVVFTISDQLTTGEVVNPTTGNKIGELKGGILYNYTNPNAGWANTTYAKAQELVEKAKMVYETHKPTLEDWWAKNPEYNNQVPLVVVKMGESSILSNEATLRVLSDNVSQFSKTRQKAALAKLKSILKAQSIKMDGTVEGRAAKQAYDRIKELNPETIGDVLSEGFYLPISITSRASLVKAIGYGSVNSPGSRKKPSSPGKNSVARALAGIDQNASVALSSLSPSQARSLEKAKSLHLGKITDLITEPSIKDVPGRNIISINTVDISESGGVIEGNHPNYPYATKGMHIGVMGNTVPVKDAFPDVYGSVVQSMTAEMAKGRAARESSIISQGTAVGMGMPNSEFVGAVANNNPSSADLLMAWLNRSFPQTIVSTSKGKFDEVMSKPEVSKQTKKGVVIYGVTMDGDIYINPDVHSSESEVFDTGIHEFGHVWANHIEQANPTLYKKGAELVKKTAEYKKWVKKYGEAKAVKEAMAILIGNKGASITDAALKSKWSNFLAAAWKYISSKFKMSKDLSIEDIQDMRLDQFIGTALADIFSGSKIGDVKNNGVEMKNPEVFFSSSESVNEVVSTGRANGFSDASIRQFLTKQGFKVKDINEALEVPLSIDETVPPEFGNIEGGMIEGMKLFNKVYKKLRAFSLKKTTKGVDVDSKTGKKIPRPRTVQEIRAKAQEYLIQELENVEASDMTKLRIQNAFDKHIGITKNKKVSESMKSIREVIRQRRRGEASIDEAKRKVRVFIRKNLPLGDYNKAQVLNLIKLVNEANAENIDAVFEQVMGEVIAQNVKIALKRVDKLTKQKFTTKQAGRKKGIIAPEDASFLTRLFDSIGNENTDVSALVQLSDAMSQKYDDLISKTELTEQEEIDLSVAIMAMDFNNALLLEDSDPKKLEQIERFAQNVSSIISTGRDQIKLEIAEAKKHYDSIKSMFFSDVSGLTVDFSNPNSLSEARAKVKKRQNLKDNRSRAVKAISDVLNNAYKLFSNWTESIEGAVDRVSRSAGEMFGGVSQELVTDRITNATSVFKGGKRVLMDTISSKAAEIYGKNWKKKLDRNSVATEFYYTNPELGKSLEEQLSKAKDKKEKQSIQRKIDEIRVNISQNEMYYLYNQYKDEANHPGFETKFGKNYEKVMENIISKLDPEVKAWADWQVEVFFPEVYPRYNSIYRKLYRTNMPQNSKYAGKLVREVESDTDQASNLFERNSVFGLNVAANSTKGRVQNKRAVKSMDGDRMLTQYIDEMEFFAAYAEPMRDIIKMVKDPDIKAAIEATSGKDAYQLLDSLIGRVVDRGRVNDQENALLDYMTNAFVKSKLGLNPTVFLKQLSSAIAMADYIGYRNWVVYGTKSLSKGVGGFNSAWKEMYANSELLKDRYENDDISRTLENYNRERKSTLVPRAKLDAWNNFLMYLIKQGDKGGVMGSIPNYMYYKEQFMSKGMSEQDAIKKAVAKVERQIGSTQQSSDIENKDLTQTGSAVLRSLNVFLSSPKALVRKEIIAVRQLARRMMGKKAKGTLKENVRTFLTYHVAIPMLFQYIALGFPGLLREFRDEDEEDLAYAAILGNINGIFLLGDLFVGLKDVITQKPWAGNLRNIPMYTVLEGIFGDAARFNKASTEETKDKYFEKMMIGLIENLTGMPINNVKKLGNNYINLAKGEVDDFGEALLRLFNYSDYQIEGPGAKSMTPEEKAFKENNPELWELRNKK